MLNFSRKDWWKDPRAVVRCANTLAYYSRRNDFRFKFDLKHPSAYVAFKNKVVGINPLFPRVKRQEKAKLRYLPKNWRTFWVHAYLAHEAAHILFTKALPAMQVGALSQMVNILEDERIERLMVQKIPSLKSTFDAMGDLFLQRGSDHSAYACCLYWRWYHDRNEVMPCTQSHLWDQVRPLVEQAWSAADVDEVLELAKQILQILGIDSADQPIPLPFCEVGVGSQGDGDQENSQEGLPSNAPSHGGEEASPDGSGIFEDNPGDDLLGEVEGYARELATMLYIPQRPALSMASRSGRFSYERYVRQSERYFEKKTLHPRKELPEIRLAIDSSGSMTGAKIISAKEVAITFVRAAQILGAPYMVRHFEEKDYEIPSGVGRYEESFKAIGEIQSGGGTILFPTLQKLLQGNKSALVVVICDGGLADHDYLQCQRILQDTPHKVMPVLLEVDAEVVSTYQRYFGKALVAQNTAELLPLVKAYVRAWWQS